METTVLLPVCYTYPVIYKIETEPSSFNEILQVLCEEVLQGSTYSNVDSTILSFVTSVIEPIGWSAVWRSSESSGIASEYDFVIEVINVSLEKLEADVVIKSIILPSVNDCDLVSYANKFKYNSCFTVPLVELYVNSEGDEEEMFAKTSMAIEYARLFYKHLRRPWDNEDDDLVYSQKVIRPRLQLYFDMKNRILPKVMCTKVKAILDEGWRKLKELDDLFSDMNLSDSETEINEDDMMQSMKLRARLGQLQVKLETLENPVIRTFMMKKYVPHKSSQMKPYPVSYVISKSFTHEMITNLPVTANTTLEFEHNAEHAFKKCSTGDRIFIFPGTYECDTLGWIDGEVSIKGIGSCSEIVLVATGNSEVFLNCLAEQLSLENLTLKATSGLLSAVVVHRGKVSVKDCAIDSNGASAGILLLGGAELVMQDSEICNAQMDGIQMRPSSSLNLHSSKIVSCSGHGIDIEIPEDGILPEHTIELNLINSQISNNEGAAIHVKNVPAGLVALQKCVGDSSILNMFSWLNHRIENTSMVDNKLSAIEMNSNCGTITNLSVPTAPKHNLQEDLECSVLNDLLNEISLRDVDITSCDDN